MESMKEVFQMGLFKKHAWQWPRLGWLAKWLFHREGAHGNYLFCGWSILWLLYFPCTLQPENRLETSESPDHKGPISRHLPGLDAELKGPPKCQTNLCSPSYFQKGWKAGGTQNEKMTKLDWFIPSPQTHIHLENSNWMLACKVYWQLFGPNTQNSTWTTKCVQTK